jgi:tRNA threonylcarbamoyladenosine biosynthesis protein TsaE
MNNSHFEYTLEEINSVGKQMEPLLNFSKIFCFKGEMGAGKTTFIEAILKEWGSLNALSSPTFSIVNEYQCQFGAVYHMDLFRIKNLEELLHFGFEEYLFSDAICFIEWHDIAIPLLTMPYYIFEIEKKEEWTRLLNISKNGV